ncbi:MAG: hypothetical protein JGK01_25505 [Microcoleus sp. PH2017_03_ELD_O_A]|uniref:hypothetical protein n=1 Tax=Microcoleus sp. PH2017_09_SFU_O_A TaxID=2798820 RepID=UPI001E099A0A|nr:hypothetical protein [Microcoleus sp. PH2017_09_SFU_O_A]MCC3444975.1 hypothetical protein [Microcoleus sp. PH2017_03_ELD_O_A]MCC3469625.1 hypothetical protein [Microcoleus sp. PH2017_06_SFM_O_A]MCC3503692.1 hypothetical protein [Microcoleus sp. PH2017_19_SFW_U_A]MCC3508328.1 hypothetical protein [Microcoleus sp. PH2017_17_BER_D_A]MCC3523939.1 hypothetical protein [Microcoleus sp. PH2017_20_SFW_D_A]MCC3554949.1 hypothetical protein [Microcoleus sp. PH2017_35_SFW_U_B]MCC3585827.1 hypothetic
MKKQSPIARQLPLHKKPSIAAVKRSQSSISRIAEQLKSNKWVYLYLCQPWERKYFLKKPIAKKRLPIGKKSDILYIGQCLLF